MHAARIRQIETHPCRFQSEIMAAQSIVKGNSSILRCSIIYVLHKRTHHTYVNEKTLRYKEQDLCADLECLCMYVYTLTYVRICMCTLACI